MGPVSNLLMTISPAGNDDPGTLKLKDRTENTVWFCGPTGGDPGGPSVADVIPPIGPKCVTFVGLLGVNGDGLPAPAGFNGKPGVARPPAESE